MTFQRIKPEVIKVRDRVLSVCSHGECRKNRIWDFDTCWIHLTDAERHRVRERLSDALRAGQSLSRVVLTGADLKGFDFTGADLSEVFFNGCNLKECKFVESNLHRAFFGGADLAAADLSRADLHGTVFTGANLEGVELLAYSISFGQTPINITMENFGGSGWKRPHINEQYPPTAEATYRALKAHFSANGKYDSASWASYCERVMQRKVFWQRKKYIKWTNSWFFGAVCGYGEKPYRAFVASIVTIAIFALLYTIFDGVVQVGSNQKASWLDILTFSVATFCGFSFPDLAPTSRSFVRLLVATEAFVGLFAFGLFIFTLTKRFVAR